MSSARIEEQTARTVLMVRPAAFSANEETASSNHFQSRAAPDRALAERAQSEFDAAVAVLRDAGVEVIVLQDTPQPSKPDAVFPNNWFSTHADGTLVLYPMLAANRRLERRTDMANELRRFGFVVGDVLDLTASESSGAYLEGTGSIVLDRVNRIAYACRSPRTSEAVLRDFARRMSYTPVMFDARDDSGRPVYHTNVILSLGRRVSAVCLDCMTTSDADRLRRRFGETSRSIIELSFKQVAAFAGNMLELATPTGACVAMSMSAKRALAAEQIDALEQLGGQLVAVDIPTIEKYGGGSLRCMLAEIHLPRTPDRRG